MRKRILTAGLLVGMTTSMLFGGTAFAGSPNHAAPGTPGDKNCKGETTAYLAQVGPEIGIQAGLGNLAAEANLTVKEIQAIIDAYCNP